MGAARKIVGADEDFSPRNDDAHVGRSPEIPPSQHESESNAPLLGVPIEEITLHAGAFRQAAEIIIQQTETGSENADLLAYPVLLLYRHHLELGLKATIAALQRRLGDRGGVEPGYDIWRLWSQLKRLHAKLYPDGPTAPIELIDRLLPELRVLDFAGSTLGHSTDDRGLRPVLVNTRWLSLRHTRAVIRKISYVLSSIQAAAEEPQDPR